eukprot:6697985-Prymnesium_polylepis.1
MRAPAHRSTTAAHPQSNIASRYDSICAARDSGSEGRPAERQPPSTRCRTDDERLCQPTLSDLETTYVHVRHHVFDLVQIHLEVRDAVRTP